MQKWRFSQLASQQVLCAVALGAVLALTPFTPSVERKSERGFVQQRPITPLPVPVALLYAEESATASAQIELSADAVYVIDPRSAAVLYEQASSTRVSPASTTKLMTALVAREQYTLETVLEVQEAAQTPGTRVGLASGEQLTVRDLLQALLIQSGNDAAMVLSENYPGGSTLFVERMNTLATELHLYDTQFQNPVGFDHPNQYTTARDLALLTKRALEDEFLRGVVQTKMSVIHDVRGNYTHTLATTNELLWKDPSVLGVKTGTTELAGQVLVTYADRGNPVLVVLLGSTDRFSETAQLLDWVYATYRWEELDVLRTWFSNTAES